MEVKIGVQHAPREVTLETDETPEDVERQVTEALAGDGVLNLRDSKHRHVIVPASKIAYVEIGGGVSGAVGFRS